LLDVHEAAELLHLRPSTVYELARSRGLPHVRIGRSVRFTREQLARWVDENSLG
jgi:excisionase family DNA binding protein